MKSSFRILVVGSSIAAALFAANIAQAASYIFIFTGPTYSITNGKFTTSGPANADGSFDITSASGDVKGLGAFTLTSGSSAPGSFLTTTDGQEDYSNLYTPGDSSFAYDGLEIQGSGFEANLYNTVNANYSACPSTDCLSVPGGSSYNPGDAGVVSIAAVPEPATWAIMLLGIFGLGTMLRMRRKQLAGVAAA